MREGGEEYRGVSDKWLRPNYRLYPRKSPSRLLSAERSQGLHAIAATAVTAVTTAIGTRWLHFRRCRKYPERRIAFEAVVRPEYSKVCRIDLLQLCLPTDGAFASIRLRILRSQKLSTPGGKFRQRQVWQEASVGACTHRKQARDEAAHAPPRGTVAAPPRAPRSRL